MTSAPAAPPPPPAVTHQRSTAIIVVLCAAAFIAMLDLFVVNVALTTIGDRFDASLADLSWVLNAYTIVYAVLLIPAGRLADRYGRKRGFMVGLALFIVASAACAASPSLPMLVLFRALQAAGAAALTPASLGLLLTVLPPERRARAVKVWATTSSLAAALGPVVGGALLTVSWHWVFLINLPVGVVVLVASWRLVPEVRSTGASAPTDLVGASLLAVGVGALALGIVKGRDWGWADPSTLATFLVAAAGLGMLAHRTVKHPSAAVDLSLLRVRTFLLANVTAILFCTAFGALFMGMVLSLQGTLGYTPLEVGLAMLPGPLMVPVFAAVGERLVQRLSTRGLVVLGNLLFALGAVLLALGAGADADYVTDILPGWVVIGIGIGLALPNLFAAATASLPAALASTGSAVLNTSRQLGYVVGVAMLVGLLGTATASATASFSHAWVAIAVIAFASAGTAFGMREK